jgi:hypothetical protein
MPIKKAPILSYSLAQDISEDEIQLRLDKAFDIIFTEMDKTLIKNIV